MSIKWNVYLGIALVFIACNDDSSPNGPIVNSSSSINPFSNMVDNSSSSSNNDLPVFSSSSLSSSSLSSSSISCLTSIDADITISDIEEMNMTCNATNDGMRVFDNTHAILMTCENGMWNESIVNLCIESSSSSSAVVESKIQYGLLQDSRDGKSYKTILIDGMEWTAENMNFYESSDGLIKVDSAFCYDDLLSNCEIYGRLYQTFAVDQACPAGWHVPEAIEWSQLSSALSSKFGSSLGNALRTGEWVRLVSSNESGFGALPGGMRDKLGSYYEISETAYFWGIDTEVFRAWELNSQKDLVLKSLISLYSSYSVRCVKD